MRAETEKWIERLRVPREVSGGDLVVTLDSAMLEGAGKARTLRVNHMRMLRHPDVLKAVAEWLADHETRDPEGATKK